MANISFRAKALSLACAFACMQALPASAMGLLKAYEEALQNDPLYRSAVAENAAGQEFQKQGKSGLLPQVQYVYSTSKNKTEQTFATQTGPVTNYPEYTSISNNISLRQVLFSLDATARYRQGIAQTNYSNELFSARAQDLMIRLVSAYGDTKFAEDQVELFTAQRNAFGEQMRINERMFKLGEGTKTDMMETQAKLDVAESQLIEAKDNLVNVRNVLAGIVGSEISQLDGLNPGFKLQVLTPASYDEWKEIALAHNAEIAAARQSLLVAEEEIAKAKAGHTPRLDLNVSYGRDIANSIQTYTQDNLVKSVGVQLVVPLYSGGYTSSAYRQAVANRDKAKSDLDGTTIKVVTELRKQFNAIQTSISKVAALEKSVQSSTLLVEATKQSVKGGVRINLDVLNAEQQLVTAKRDLAQAKYNYLVGYLKLRVAAGNVTVGDLQEVASYFSSVN